MSKLVIGNGKYVMYNGKIVTFTAPPPKTLKLTFDNIANVPVADAASVSDWNTFFDLPTKGTPFTSVGVVGNEATLSGGNGITLKRNIFSDSTCASTLTKLEDTGCIVDMECGWDADSDFSPFYHYNYTEMYQNNCEVLTEVIFTSITSVGLVAFQDSPALVSVTMGNSVTSIGGWAFVGCPSLTSIIIPDSVITIGDAAFFACTSLASATIGAGVTNIETTAFGECPILMTVNMRPITAPTVDATYTFYDNGATLHIRSGAAGYNVNPWTNTAKFASIVQDL